MRRRLRALLARGPGADACAVHAGDSRRPRPAVRRRSWRPAHIAASPDGARLPLRVLAAAAAARPNAVVLALHGFNDYSNFFDGAGTLAAPSAASPPTPTISAASARAPNRGLWPGTRGPDRRSAPTRPRRCARAIPACRSTCSARAWAAPVVMALMATATRRPTSMASSCRRRRSGAAASMPWYQRWRCGWRRTPFPGSRLTGAGLGIQAVRQHRDAARARTRSDGDQGDAGRRRIRPGQPDGSGDGGGAACRGAGC